MANLDVALRLRLLNALKPGAAEAKRDLDGIREAAQRLNVHGVRDVASLHRGIQREADRRARDARDGALHDTGSEVA